MYLIIIPLIIAVLFGGGYPLLFILLGLIVRSGDLNDSIENYQKRKREKRIKKEKERRDREERYIRLQEEAEIKQICSEKYTKLFNDNNIVIKDFKFFYKDKLIKISDITDVYYIYCSDVTKNSYDCNYFNLIINYNSTKNIETYISRKFTIYEKAECDRFICDVLKKYDLIKKKEIYHCEQKIFFSQDWIRTDKEEIPYKDVYQKGIIKDGYKYRYKVNDSLSEPIADKGILNKIDFIIEKKLRNLNISFKNIRS